MTTATVGQPWWRSAPNPPCASWCERDHPADDFRQGGAMGCIAMVEQTDSWSVEVWSHISLDETDTAIEVDPANVAVDIRADVFLTPDECAALAAAIVKAGQIARATVR